MPRIQAASVVENRDLRRTALLQAARDLLLAGGDSAVTITAAAVASGLSRPAVYEYFPSSAALREALVKGQAERWTTVVEAALCDATAVIEIVRAFVETSLRTVSGDAPRGGLSDLQFSHFSIGPGKALARHLARTDVPDPELVARLVTSAVVSVTRAQDQREDLVPTVTTFLVAGLEGLSAGRSPQ